MSNDEGVGFILETFVRETQGVRHVQTVSADGIHLAASGGLQPAQMETFAAIASGLASLSDGAAETFGVGTVTRQIIESSAGWILIARLSNTASIGVVAEPNADLGLVGYEMTLLAERLGQVLSPKVVERLKNMVGVHA